MNTLITYNLDPPWDVLLYRSNLGSQSGGTSVFLVTHLLDEVRNVG